jgi:hypothetical protein
MSNIPIAFFTFIVITGPVLIYNASNKLFKRPTEMYPPIIAMSDYNSNTGHWIYNYENKYKELIWDDDDYES